MATFFRATIMLTALVGLPSAWVYYGPLPPEAMGVIERTVNSAKHSMGWDNDVRAASWTNEPTKTAPRFDPVVADAAQTLQQEPTSPMMRDSQFSLASATVTKPSQPTTGPPESPTLGVDQGLASKLEPHLSLLRSLNAAEYTLENWGGDQQLYRFRCAVTLGDTDDHTRQFEAIDADPVRAVHQVVGEVTSWQNARLTSTTTRWQ